MIFKIIYQIIIELSTAFRLVVMKKLHRRLWLLGITIKAALTDELKIFFNQTKYKAATRESMTR